MNPKIFFSLICFVFAILIGACNSTPYEIVEIEDEPDTVKTSNYTEIKTDLNQPKQEIKEKIDEEKVATENINNNSTSNSSQYSVNYVIQIGAFIIERNADRFTAHARNKTQIEVYSQFIDGLYKVRYGSFSNKSEASEELSRIKGSGFWDSFIVEIKKLN